jgi:hypothetical protein
LPARLCRAGLRVGSAHPRCLFDRLQDFLVLTEADERAEQDTGFEAGADAHFRTLFRQASEYPAVDVLMHQHA